MYGPSHPGCDYLGAVSKHWKPLLTSENLPILWLSTDPAAHLRVWVTRNSGYVSHSITVWTQKLLDHESWRGVQPQKQAGTRPGTWKTFKMLVGRVQKVSLMLMTTTSPNIQENKKWLSSRYPLRNEDKVDNQVA